MICADDVYKNSCFGTLGEIECVVRSFLSQCQRYPLLIRFNSSSKEAAAIFFSSGNSRPQVFDCSDGSLERFRGLFAAALSTVHLPQRSQRAPSELERAHALA